MKTNEQKNISLLGFLFDKKSSFLKGSAAAPPLIRESLSSYAVNSFAENGVDIRDKRIIDRGDFAIKDFIEIEKIVSRYLKAGEKVLSLGGDHSISYPVIKAYHKYYSSIEIIHIDAHPDLYDELDGDKFSHACPFARILEEKLAVRLVQIGIRALNPHQREQAKRFGTEIIEMKDFSPDKIPGFKNPVYISIDMDGIDPAFAPGVSHHEPGGLTSREVVNIIGNIDVPVIGADIVEFNPVRDTNGITAALAAKLTKEILSKMIING